MRGRKIHMEEFIDQLVELPLQFSPGSSGIIRYRPMCWAHIEVVSGQTLDVFLTENIFMPLGMNDTSFTIDDDKRARLAHNYSRDPVSGITSLADSPEKTIYAPVASFYPAAAGFCRPWATI